VNTKQSGTAECNPVAEKVDLVRGGREWGGAGGEKGFSLLATPGCQEKKGPEMESLWEKAKNGRCEKDWEDTKSTLRKERLEGMQTSHGKKFHQNRECW